MFVFLLISIMSKLEKKIRSRTTIISSISFPRRKRDKQSYSEPFNYSEHVLPDVRAM